MDNNNNIIINIILQYLYNDISNFVASKHTFTSGNNWDIITYPNIKLPAELIASLYSLIIVDLYRLVSINTNINNQIIFDLISQIHNSNLYISAELERIENEINIKISEIYKNEKELLLIKQRSKVFNTIIDYINNSYDDKLVFILNLVFAKNNTTSLSKSVQFDRHITKTDKILHFSATNYILSAVIVKQLLILGSFDGFIEVYNLVTGKLNTEECRYQAQDIFMNHYIDNGNNSVVALTTIQNTSTSLEINRHVDLLLASGTVNGDIKIWDVLTGNCICFFPKAHSKSITSLILFPSKIHINSNYPIRLISASYDSLIRVFGIGSKQVLKEFRGHASYIVSILLFNDRLVSASADGSIKIWDMISNNCINTIKPFQINKEAIISITCMIALLDSKNRFIVSNQSNIISMLDVSGNLIKTFYPTNSNVPNLFFLSLSLSIGNQDTPPIYLYALGSNSVLYIFDLYNTTVQDIKKLHDGEIIGIVSSLDNNILVSYSLDRNCAVKIWK